MKIILLILVGWIFFKIKKMIKNIKISSASFSQTKDIHKEKINMDIQDGDFEEVK